MGSLLNRKAAFPYLWKTSLACFIAAALTGFLYRLGLIGWLPDLLHFDLVNIRHAHSHLMFFGWAVPFPLYILLKRLVDRAGIPERSMSWMRHSLSAGLVLGILAFPVFLVYGYKPVTIGGSSLPLSVILSGLVMITWYTYAWGYIKARNLLQGELSQPWFDGALILLVVCSLGAWGVAVVQAIDPSNQLFMKGLTHFFLATFTEGWVVLSVLAIAIAELPLKSREWLLSADFSLGCIAIGTPLTFALGISETMLSPALLISARAGSFLAAFGLLVTLFTFFRSGTWNRKLWGWAMVMLALKGLMQLIASFYPSLFWLSDHGLRILYLHLLLLGGFSLAIIGWWHNRTNLPDVYFSITAGSVLAVLISLIFPTSFWPIMWSGFWIFYALMIAALLPPVAVLLEWMNMSRSEKHHTD